MDQPSIQDVVPEGSPGMDTVLNKGYKTPGDVVKAYSELLKLHNSGFRAPKEGASSETWRDFYTQIGAPESAEGYEIPEGAGAAESILSGLREAAHGVGLTNKQWAELSAKAVELQNGNAADFDEKLSAAQKEWQAKAEEQYGADFSKKIGKAQKVYEELVKDAPEIDALLSETKLKNHPALVQLMMKVSDSVSDASTPSRSAGGPPAEIKGALEIAARIKELAMGPEFSNPHHPRKALAMQEYQQLQQQLAELGYQGATDPRLRFPGY